MTNFNDFFFGGRADRSTYHATCVKRVKSHLARMCTIADKEQGLVSGRITDAWGYDGNKQLWYLCEIKVVETDLYKSPVQIHDTARRFQLSSDYVKTRGVIVSVIAIPKRFYDELGKYADDKWKSFRVLCKQLNIAIWVIEQSTVRQIQGPKPKTVKTKKAVTKAAKPKPSKAITTKAKSKKTTTKPKKSSVKSSTIKKSKAPATKSNISKVRATKAKVVRIK